MARVLPRTLAFAALLASAALLAGAAAPAGAVEYRSVKGVQPGRVVWVHAKPDPASKRVGYLKAEATRVHTSGCKTLASGGWCHVTVQGTRGWVQDRYLKAGGGVMRG